MSPSAKEGSVDLVLTDLPYNIGVATKEGKKAIALPSLAPKA